MCEGDFAPDVIDWENREAGRQLPSENLCHPRHFWQRLRLRTILCGSRPTDSATLHPGLRRRAEARWGPRQRSWWSVSKVFVENRSSGATGQSVTKAVCP